MVAAEVAWTEAELQSMETVETQVTNKDGETETIHRGIAQRAARAGRLQDGATTITSSRQTTTRSTSRWKRCRVRWDASVAFQMVAVCAPLCPIRARRRSKTGRNPGQVVTNRYLPKARARRSPERQGCMQAFGRVRVCSITPVGFGHSTSEMFSSGRIAAGTGRP